MMEDYKEIYKKAVKRLDSLSDEDLKAFAEGETPTKTETKSLVDSLKNFLYLCDTPLRRKKFQLDYLDEAIQIARKDCEKFVKDERDLGV